MVETWSISTKFVIKINFLILLYDSLIICNLSTQQYKNRNEQTSCHNFKYWPVQKVSITFLGIDEGYKVIYVLRNNNLLKLLDQ